MRGPHVPRTTYPVLLLRLEPVEEATIAMEEDLLKRWGARKTPRSKTKIGKPLHLAPIAAALDPRTKDIPRATQQETKYMYGLSAAL